MLGFLRRRLADLPEREILALAIASEEEDQRIYASYAAALADAYPATARLFSGMAAEEQEHHDRLLATFRARFGEHVPLIRRGDVHGVPHRPPLWLVRPFGVAAIRRQVEAMERQSEAFYRRAAAQVPDGDVKALLTSLAAAESGHVALADTLAREHMTAAATASESEAERRRFVLQYVQPGLAGLMDGSVSTLAPLFAAAFATHNSHDAFAVGLAAAVGAGISMGFAEALSDDGALSGRGSPIARGAASGVMTAIGGLGHTLPYLIPHFLTATVVAALVVAVELVVIAWIRHRWMDTPFLRAAYQVVFGGVLVFLAGIFIGSA
jgi:rubrerythrin